MLHWSIYILLYSIIKWTLRAWPFLVTLLIIFIHQLTSMQPCFFQWMCWSNEIIDKYLSFGLNISGGILVIYSIDSNLGIFKKGNLFLLFSNWVKSFPLIKRKSITVTSDLCISNSIAHPVQVELTKQPESIEELYKYTQEQVYLLRKDLQSERRSRDEALSKMANEWSSKHSTINENISEINYQLKAIAIGGIKLQMFGVLLVIYGSYIAL